MAKTKKITIHFPDDFKFPQYYQEKNITKEYTFREEKRTYTRSSCDSCPFDYDSIVCILREDETDGPWKCPFYDSDEVEFDAKEPV